MLNGISFGNYIPADSLLHRTDPRVKLIMTLGISIVVFLVGSTVGYALLALILVAGMAASRVNPLLILRSMKSLVWLLLLTFVLNAAFIEGERLVSLGFIGLSREGIVYGLRMVVRIAILLVASGLLTISTSPMQLTDGLEALLRPFSRFGVPAHDLAMMMSIALRFIPTLSEEAQRIAAAQASRGAAFGHGGFAGRSRAIISLMVPLFVGSFRRADELAMAMESRCYNGGVGRTRLNPLRATTADAVLLVAVSSVLVVAVLL